MPLPRVNKPGSVPADGSGILGNNDAAIVFAVRADGQGRAAADPPADVAHDDFFEIVEQQHFGGNLFADNGSGADENLNGGTLWIATVNGEDDWGNFYLPSGALLYIERNGAFTYDPRHAFNPLAGPDSGASNTSYDDHFTYTLEGGSSATVTIRINGLDGIDSVEGTSGNDILFAGVLNDNVLGYAGNDQLTGGTGADDMYGGPGDDFFYVDNVQDRLLENPGEGFDVVWSSISFELTNFTGADSLEALSTSSWEATTAIDLTGNMVGNDIYGNAGANRLDGAEGADSLFGLGGNDMLIGGTGNDYMYGGAGDDFFFVDSLLDRTFENTGQGYDVVWSTVSYALAAGSEIEVLSSRFWESTAPLILVGSDLANTIYANAGDNVLNGHGGSDTLFGFGGADSFLFDSALGPTNIDYIVDYSSAADTIVLDDSVFAALTPGGLNPNAFFVGSAAHDSDDRIVYDSSNGLLYYDADGNGGGGAILFAVLQGAPVIGASDFAVI